MSIVYQGVPARLHYMRGRRFVLRVKFAASVRRCERGGRSSRAPLSGPPVELISSTGTLSL
jgi:hypothetical protein